MRAGHQRVAKLLHAEGCVLGFSETEASGELCELARQGSLDILKLMLQCGANVDAVDYDSRSCLHLAASEGNLPIVEYLITTGRASINCVDRFGGTPLADAIRYAHSAVAKCLISFSAELKWDEVRASGELCEAARKGDVFRIELLLLAKCDVNAADCACQLTPLPNPDTSLLLSAMLIEPPRSNRPTSIRRPAYLPAPGRLRGPVGSGGVPGQ